ncbi:hypothetical protein [Luteibacter sp. RCC_6_2]|uniref:hypothetical protein n=1 Tax=Luteibacter sp. RCC_6_2 TaxID=3239223 RepID=UPI0035247EEC
MPPEVVFFAGAAGAAWAADITVEVFNTNGAAAIPHAVAPSHLRLFWSTASVMA